MTDRLDLPLRYRDQLEALLRQHVPDVEVWAYGSRVNGRSHDGSDLDLVLRSPTLEPLGDGYLDLVEVLEQSNIPILVQAHDWAMLPESFHREIERGYVVMQERAKYTAAGRWPQVRLADLGEVGRGRSRHRPRHAPELYGGLYPFVQTGDIKASGGRITSHNQTYNELGLAQSRLWPTNTMAITIAANIAETAILTYPACFPDSVVGFIADDSRCHVRFVEYQFRLLRNKIQQEHEGTGSVQDNINLQTLADLRFPLPPLPEQRAIAHILGTLDDKIELNRRMNQTLEEMARAIFHDWFVDFGPVRAILEGREPYLPPELWDLFPDRLVDSELGEIPEGWGVKALEELIQLNPRELMKKGTVAPYLDMVALPTSGLSPDDAILREFTSGTRFRNGDTLLARITPCLENGKTAFIQSLPEETVGWGSTEFIVMRPLLPVSPEYTYLLARSGAFREHAIQSMTGTSGRQRVQVDALAPYLLPFPPTDVWATFSSLVGPMFVDIEITRKQSYSLAAQRDALLPRLVSGELRTVGLL